MNLIMHIVGNRPQFIKLAPISAELHRRGIQDVILHTGQHYDFNMSDIFFKELSIDKPYCNLNIGSGSHAEMVGNAMIAIEKELIRVEPSIIIIYGDTNTTLAAALAAKKLNIPVVHVEAGIRSYNKQNPEECNRLIADHLSDVLFCSDRQSVLNLQKEGIIEKVYYFGDIMYDTFLYIQNNTKSTITSDLKLENNDFILMTWHRQENTESEKRISDILNFIKNIEKIIVFPIHPRTKHALEKFDMFHSLANMKNVILIDPIGYLDMVKLLSECSLVLTNSGGLSKESYFAGIRCLFMMDLDIWPDLVKIGWITKVILDNDKSIKNAINIANQNGKNTGDNSINYFGDGYASRDIVDNLLLMYT